MKRRITILFGTFAVLLAAFLVYYLVSAKNISEVWSGKRPPVSPGGGPSDRIRDVEVAPVTNMTIYQYDKQHRLRAKYTTPYWEKAGDKFYLKQPRVEWYLRGGQMVILRAEEGIVTAEEVAGRWNVHRGRLIGNVKVVMDRRTDPDRSDRRARPEDLVSVHIDDDVHFDRDLLTIRSDGRVKVTSREADIWGTGLRLSWSEDPQQLRELRIDHGDRMYIREGQERFVGQMTLPGGSGPAEPVDDEPPPAGSLEPPAAEEVPASAPADAPASAPATGSTRLATGGPAALATSEPAEPLPVVPDTFVATFSENVRVTSGPRRLEGIDELRLVLEFKGSQEEDRRSGEDRSPATRPAGETAATGPAETMPSATTRPAGPTKAGRAEPVVITWTGPLVVRPFRSREKPIPKRFDVAATGKRLELMDGRARAVCRTFSFSSTGRTGELVGSPGKPVKLTMAKGERISARRVRFNRGTGVVNLDGAGSMQLPVSASGRPVVEDEDGDQERRKLTITWTKNVVALLGRRRIETDAGPGSEEFLRSATFVGDVDVQQENARSMKAGKLMVRFSEPVSPGDPVNRIASLHAEQDVYLKDAGTGDFVRSQVLDVEMAEPSAGDAGPAGTDQAYPRRVVATGNVKARQDQSEITAGKMLTITFAPERDAKTGKVEIKPQRLDADGGVKIIDRGGSEPVVAVAETLTTDMSAKTATLTGEPARVTQKGKTGKDNVIEGRKIVLDQNSESVAVAGAGRLRFYNDTDISGNKVEQPRPVDIAWREKMDFCGKKEIAVAIVTGGVHLKTAGDELKCGRMEVHFAPAKAKAETRPAATTRATEFRQFRSRRIETVVAREKVRLESLRKDKEGFWLQRVWLQSDDLRYDAPGGERAKGVIRCNGPGAMSVEDYRPPEKRPAGEEAEVIPGGVSRPSQSAFQWSKWMRMNQADRAVWMSGSVRMVHASGRQMVLVEKLKVRPWGKLPAGRKTVMSSGRMFARFDPPAAGPRASASSGSRVGPLALFDAAEDVNLRDGPRQVLCQRILYQRSRDIAIMWGSLPGRPAKNAVLYYQDDEKGVVHTTESPKIIWHRKNNRIDTEGVEAHGGR